ncbi:MAG: Uma2 family endonuclease [Nostoc sp. ChiQUE01a]|nr:Uma2 family endonuclease [Nostoc sp. ChiQUE01a]
MAASIEQNFDKSIRIPPLESGDRLSRHEFERRYSAMPHVKKAELIEGIVYVASPLRFNSHGKPHGDLIIWLGTYKVATPGVELGDNVTVRLDLDNEPQPDVVLLIDEKLGGQARISNDDYIEGAPELIAEVAASSAANDLHDKKKVYRRNGVKEYIVWRILENQLDWFCLENGEYISLEPDINNVIKSRIFPGLWLDVQALCTGKMAKVLAVLQQGLSSEEHAEFVQSLA